MEQLVSMIVANGLWAALFCILLAIEIRDSRRRETRYTATINSLSDRLGAVNAVKSETTEIKENTVSIKTDTKAIRAACVRARSAKSGAV